MLGLLAQMNQMVLSTSILDDFKVITPRFSEPLSQDENQAQKQVKSGSISENRNRASEPDKNVTNQTKNNTKNTTGSITGSINEKKIEPKKAKSMPKNTTGSINSLNQEYADLEGRSQKAKTDKNTKRYSYFNCTKCHFMTAIRIDIKSRIGNETLHDIHKKAHPDHKLQYSNEDETL